MARWRQKRLFFAVALALTFAAAWLLPAAARAAIVPACENHQLTRMPVEWLPASPAVVADMCAPAAELAPPAEELGDTRVAAMCDGRGASVIAPSLVRAISDARIDAGSACELDVTSPVVGPGPHDAPGHVPSAALAQDATLGAGVVLAAASCEILPAYPPPGGAARAGVKRGIEHPPR